MAKEYLAIKKMFLKKMMHVDWQNYLPVAGEKIFTFSRTD